jgi:predicted nucleotidyltransferase
MPNDSLEQIIMEAIERILSVAQPTKILLFGSAIHGKLHKDSDLDLLVIMPSGVHRRKTAQKIYRNMIGLGFAVDVVVVTEEDVDQFRHHQGMIINPALNEGKVLYAA